MHLFIQTATATHKNSNQLQSLKTHERNKQHKQKNNNEQAKQHTTQ